MGPSDSFVDRPERALWNRFLATMSGVAFLVLAAAFMGLCFRSRAAVREEQLARARTQVQTIVWTREWNARFGGVYVEKRDGVETNPYLRDADLVAADGRVLTLRNPAIMTREIAKLSGAGPDRFRVTSLRPVNPQNAPDEFERRALERFARGAREAYGHERAGGRVYFRYLAPLLTEPSCLRCHAEHGYTAGMVRGGISVRLDVTELERRLRNGEYTIAGLALFASLLLLGSLHLLTRDLSRKLSRAHARIRDLAVTDELTGVQNRRYFFEHLRAEWQRARRYGHPLSCLMIDIDHFKVVNDTHGHQAGDRVLRAVASLLRGCCRAADTVARYGGEEFVVLLPETGMADALAVAEKLRTAVERADLGVSPDGLRPVTVSVGASSSGAGFEGNEDDLVRAADQALYRAKGAGRNRVAGATEEPDKTTS